METRLPFPGFYESLYSLEFDSIEDNEVEYIMNGEYEFDVPECVTSEDMHELFYKHADYSGMYQEIAKQYPYTFSDFLAEKTGMLVPLEFTIMTSPREYNFETDRVFATIKLEDVLALYEFVGEERLRKEAKDMFTSRSGFISFYSPKIEEWGPVSEWDHNQLYCLMNCLVDSDDDLTIYYRLEEAFYTAFQNNINWEDFARDLKFFGEEYEMNFPSSSIKDQNEYVKSFNELNHLRSS